MNKVKINMVTKDYVKDVIENPISEESKHALEYLLSENQLPDCYWDTDEDAKTKFDAFFDANDEEQLFFVGNIGTGKTQFLKSYFLLSPNDNFWIKGKKMLIFLSADGSGIVENQDIVKHFAEELKKVCIYYREHYMDTREIISEDYGKFYRFIVETKREALPGALFMNESTVYAYEKAIKNLKEEKPFTYYMMKLKYYLLLSKKISDVIFICDNIESKEVYANIAVKAKKCICNYDRGKYPGYFVKSIFAMDQKTYREINEMASGEIIKKERTLNIQSLIDVRFHQAEMSGEKWMQERGFNMPALQSAKNMLDYLNTRFNQKYQKMILGLSLYNKELVLKCYKKIVFNKTWVRKRRFSYAKDVYDENTDFLFNNITCIRALACGNEQIYNPERDSDHLIPNILYYYNEEEEEEYGLYNLLLMKCFARQRGGYARLENADGDILKACKQIWGNGKEYESFKIAIDYLRHMKILEEYVGKTECASRCGCKLSISEKGAELWDMLRSDSLLMELCREDCYRTQDSNMESSYYLLNTEQQYIIFEDLLMMVNQFSEKEDKLYQAALDRGHNEEYINAFGKKRMAFYLLEGISKSITYSVSRTNDNLKRFRNEVWEKVTSARE